MLNAATAAIPPILAFAISLAGTYLLAYSRLAHLVLDRPNERSLHEKPIARTGGLAVLAGILLASPLAGANIPVVVWAGMVVLLTVSLVDDVRGIPVVVRFATHLTSAAAAAVTLLSANHGFITLCVTALFIAWMVNLYNFMDGADGLAGGMAVFGFSVYGIAAWTVGNMGFAVLNFCIAAAALGFLVFNFHPARIFLGDAGSIPLGFLAGSLGIIGWVNTAWPWWFPLLVFSPFIVDASVTLARRACAGVAVWRAHRDHYYQRLVRLGWGHRRTALAEYGLMGACGIAALLALDWTPHAQAMMLIAVAAVYAAIIAAITMAWRKTEIAQDARRNHEH